MPAGWRVRCGINKRRPWLAQRWGSRSNRGGPVRSSSTAPWRRQTSWRADGLSSAIRPTHDGRQPYHAAAGTARKPGPQLDKLVASVEKFGRQSVDAFIREQEKAGTPFRRRRHRRRQPDRSGPDCQRPHPHSRARRTAVPRHVKAATDRRKLAASVWRERDLYGFAEKQLKQSEGQLRQTSRNRGVI